LIFEGKFIQGERNGKGKEYFFNGTTKFFGDYFHGREWTGEGYDIEGKKIYTLNDGKGIINESIKRFLKNKIIFIEYKYEYLNGGKNGRGKKIIDNKLSFEGNFFNGKKNGKGIEYDNQERKLFEGEYFYDEKLKGKEFIKGRLEYEGTYFFGTKWNGKGDDENGNIIYELNNGTGKVRQYKDGELIFDGEYFEGKKNGHGKKYYSNGNLKFEGEYFEGKKWDGKYYLYDNNEVKELLYVKGEIIYEELKI